AYLAQAVAVVTWLSRRTARLARETGRGRVATGMVVHSWGEVPIFVFALHMAAYNTALLFGVVPPWPEADVDQVLMPFGTCLLLLGLAIAAAGGGGQVRTVFRRFRYHRHRALVHPLWTEVAAAMPAVVYADLPAAKGFLPDRRAERHAYRTVVELRDALVLLCQIGVAPPLDGDSATRAAEVFAAGLPAWRTGSRPGDGDPVDPPVTSAPTLLIELQWWVRVAKARRRDNGGRAQVRRGERDIGRLPER
ncbi:MAG TPA: DUF6545 domain-containing protein, partial [Umezawaea sp.]|nr:DUF6545 domain-containing protein [Umezawaea sp.]